MTKLIGRAAINYAIENGLNVNKFADPTEGELLGLSIDEAREIAIYDSCCGTDTDWFRCAHG